MTNFKAHELSICDKLIIVHIEISCGMNHDHWVKLYMFEYTTHAQFLLLLMYVETDLHCNVHNV